MLLTYDKTKRHFVLSDVFAQDRLLKGRPAWEKFARGSYVTTDWKEARKFQARADDSTKRLFDRAFIKHFNFVLPSLPKILDLHQQQGVHWVLSRSRSYLAHAPGAGKTVEAIVASLYTRGEGQTLFIVPPSLTANWERETNRFTKMLAPGDLLTVSVIPDSSKASEADWNADYIIVPDSMLTKDWVLRQLIKMKKKFVAVDEASRFKDANASRTIAVFGGKSQKFKSPGLIYDSRHVVLLDGSPMPNRSIELWAPTFAMCPEAIDFMSEKQFAFAYCDPRQNDRGEWEFKGTTNADDLKKRLQESFMHVVTEDKLGHSPRLRSLVFVEDNRRPTLRAWERKWLGKMSMWKRPVEDWHKMKTGTMVSGSISEMRKRCGLAMVEPALKYIRERLEMGEAVLVFAWHREVVKRLWTELKKYKPGVIIGGVLEEYRENAIQSFQGGKRNLLIMNIAAGGRGHNIQRADRIIFVEPSWSDEQNKQCEKRASRRGRDVRLPVKSDYLVVEGSINELVLSSAFTKEKRVKNVIG